MAPRKHRSKKDTTPESSTELPNEAAVEQNPGVCDMLKIKILITSF
jgi:hypothetical protein